MLSVVVLTKNEEKNILECVKTLDWCDEIIVIDDNSVDGTVEIAKKNKATVYKRELDNDFSSQRNFGLRKAKGDWVLFIDADERLTPTLAKEIQEATKDSKVDGYLIKRQDYFWGRKLKFGETNISLLRLAKKGKGEWTRVVHEEWQINGSKQKLKGELSHYPHQTLREFITDIDFYSTLHARANQKEGKHSSIFKIIFYPKLKFLQNWIIKGGIFDGNIGFLVALLMSLHSFLAWSKLWLWQKNQNAS